MSEQANHPFIYFAVSAMKDIKQALREGEFHYALSDMRYILNSIEEKQSTEWEKVDKKLNELRQPRRDIIKVNGEAYSETPLREYDFMHSEDYHETASEIWALLWKFNYLRDEKFGMVYPSEMSKSKAYKSPLLSPLAD